jgi:hypothetical protein
MLLARVRSHGSAVQPLVRTVRQGSIARASRSLLFPFVGIGESDQNGGWNLQAYVALEAQALANKCIYENLTNAQNVPDSLHEYADSSRIV